MSSYETTNPPIPNSYWVIPGRFAAGEYLGDTDPGEATQKLDTLLQAGINHFIDLTETADLLEPYRTILQQEAQNLGINAAYEHHPIRDLDIPRTPIHMAGVLDAIGEALDNGDNVYLHCWGGVGRTGTAVGCWLVRQGHTGDNALQQLQVWWQSVQKAHRSPRSPETNQQRQYVRNWTENLETD